MEGQLREVQNKLDQNKLLISEINQNHERRTPEALQRNTLLIKQLNTNVGSVVKTYQDLSRQVEQATQQAGG